MLAMGLLDDLQSNFLRAVTPIKSQQALENMAVKVGGNLDLAIALALTGNINLATGKRACDLNWLRAAAHVDSQDPRSLSSASL